MQDYKYLIIGGGMTADSAVSGIREVDPSGSIGLISAEPNPPYDRPPLTKSLWKDKPLDSIWRHTEAGQAHLHLGRTVKSLDLEHKKVADDQNEEFSFKKLLLATGGAPRRLHFGRDHIIYFRTVHDYRRLRELADKGTRFAVIGGGFIGSELAAALSMNRKEVIMLFPGSGICARVFPPDLSQFLNGYYRQKGVDVWNNESAASLEHKEGQLVLKTKSGREAKVDAVVAGIGIQPNLDLAKAAGLKTEDGIVVDALLRTSHPDVYAAGDVASFYNPALDRRLRVEHEDNANNMGKNSGRNMGGAAEPYHHLPFFYSDLFDLGYEAVGELDSRLSVVADWKKPHQEGVLYYQKEGFVRGVLLWNVWNQVDAARKLIEARRPYQPEALKQKLPQAA